MAPQHQLNAFRAYLSVGSTVLDYAGEMSKFKPPKIAAIVEKADMPDYVSPLELDMGRVETMEATATFHGFNAGVLALFGRPAENGESYRLQVRGSKGPLGAEVAVVYLLGGFFKDQDPSEWEAGKSGEVKATMSLSYAQLTEGGSEIYEIDVERGILSKRGTDVLAARRRNLGAS